MSYKVSYTGPEIDAALKKSLLVDTHANGWIKIASSKDKPVSLNNLTSPGNYTIDNWSDGPIMDPVNAGPLNLCITSATTTVDQCVYHLKNSYIRSYTLSTKTWGDWGKQERDTEYAITATAPTSPGENAIWVDITTPEKPEIKIFLKGAWHGMNPSALMNESVYDPTGQKTDVFAYVDTAITNADLGSIQTDFTKHIEDSVIHVTATEKTIWNNKPTPTEFQTKLAEIQADMETKVSSKATEMQTQVGGMTTSVDSYVADLTAHTTDTEIHATSAEKLSWNSKAEGDHTHLSDGRVEIDASAIVSGIVHADRIDRAALERVMTVQSDAERLALTIKDVQDGDLVYVKGLQEWKLTPIRANEVKTDDPETEYSARIGKQGLSVTSQWNATGVGTPSKLILSASDPKGPWFQMEQLSDTEISGIDLSIGMYPTSLSVANGKFYLATSKSGPSVERDIYSSINGRSWKKASVARTTGIVGATEKYDFCGNVATSGSKHVILTRDMMVPGGDHTIIYYSTDAEGHNWTPQSISHSALKLGWTRLQSVIFFKQKFYAFGSQINATSKKRELLILSAPASGSGDLVWSLVAGVTPATFGINPATSESELDSAVIVDSKIVVLGRYDLADAAPTKIFTATSSDGATWTRTLSTQLDAMKQPFNKIFGGTGYAKPQPFKYIAGRYYTTSCTDEGTTPYSSRSAIISSADLVTWEPERLVDVDKNPLKSPNINFTSIVGDSETVFYGYTQTPNAVTGDNRTPTTAYTHDLSQIPAFFYVIHDNLLGTEGAFQRFSTGGSAVADWNNIVNTPNTLEGYGITDAYTTSEIDKKIEHLTQQGAALLKDATTMKPIADVNYSTLETQVQTLTSKLSNVDQVVSSLDDIAFELDYYAKKIATLATS